MPEPALPLLAEWESFYVIVGSSAAALTGLQFVVIALGAEAKRLAGDEELGAFATPTIVHFCMVLLLAAALSTPRQTAVTLGICLGVGALVGLAYTTRVILRARRTTKYVPVAEDWVWHGGLPMLAYASLLIAALTAGRHPEPALYIVGAISLLLLYIGIHNAWDAAVWMAVHRQAE